MKETLDKIKIHLDLKTFVIILCTVSGFVASTTTILNKIDGVVITQAEMKSDLEEVYACQKTTENKLAWLEPTVQMIMKKIGL